MLPFPISRRLTHSGDRLSPSETNELLNYLQQQNAAPAPIGSEIGVGYNGRPIDFRQPDIWGQIQRDRIGNRYGWVRCSPQEDGSVPADPTDSVTTDRGTPDTWPAIEVNGNTRVRTGTVVRLVQGTGPYVEFEHDTESEEYPYSYGSVGSGGGSVVHSATINIGCNNGEITGDEVEYTTVGLMRRNRLFISVSMEIINEDKIMVPTVCKEFLTADTKLECVDGTNVLTKVTEIVKVIDCGACE